MTDWTALTNELALWRAQGRDLPIWWRDDDAIAPSAPLDRLAALSQRLNLPVHLAVIPANATPELAARCADDPLLPVLVHGWAHRSHATGGAKKTEFGADRPAEVVAQDAARGLERLRELFGPTLLPVFVPPWNRIAPEIIAALPALGYRAVSTYQPRDTATPVPGLVQINTHLDPIDWRGTRGVVAPQILIDRFTANLAARRNHETDPTEPFGLLTHHLVHDEAIWEVTERLLNHLLQGGARPVHLGTELEI